MSVTVAKFLWKNIITQHDVFNRLICDEESENKMWIKDLADLYEIECVMMSVYNFRTNEMIEHEHKSLINELSKMTDKDLEKWINLLFLILWMNQIIIKHNTDWTLYELLYNYVCVLSIETHIFTWTTLV